MLTPEEFFDDIERTPVCGRVSAMRLDPPPITIERADPLAKLRAKMSDADMATVRDMATKINETIDSIKISDMMDYLRSEAMKAELNREYKYNTFADAFRYALTLAEALNLKDEARDQFIKAKLIHDGYANMFTHPNVDYNSN